MITSITLHIHILGAYRHLKGEISMSNIIISVHHLVLELVRDKLNLPDTLHMTLQLKSNAKWKSISSIMFILFLTGDEFALITGFFFVGSNGEAIVFYSYRRVSNFHKKMGCSS